MEKIDFKRALKDLYTASAKSVDVIDVPPLQFLMIDGHGDPNTAVAYKDALATLYPVAYALKFLSKQELGRDYTVPPLEGLWWVEDMAQFSVEDKSSWDWTMMIMTPDWLTAVHLDAALAKAAKKAPPALNKLRLESYAEGRSAQILHVGPYAAEAPTIARLHAAIAEAGYALRGKHHEIYLGDPKRVAPEKLKTIIRQPVARP